MLKEGGETHAGWRCRILAANLYRGGRPALRPPLGDEGVQHVTPDDQGRLMVQGLLTATLPTKIGGDINFIARQMIFQFHRPVFSGDTVQCDVTIVELEPASSTPAVMPVGLPQFNMAKK